MQQRDYGNELIAAVAAVALVAFAVTFGILLSVSSTEQEEITATVVAPVISALPEITATEEETPTATATDTLIPPTPSATTAPPSVTPTVATATATVAELTDTSTPSATIPITSAVSIATNTAAPTNTVTPTASATSTTTNTPSATNSPTLTQTATLTSTMTVTPTPTRMTPSPVMASASPIATSSAELTITPLPAITTTPAVELGILPTPTGHTCVPRTEWSVYEVEPGTTLFTIAVAVNSTVGELRDANCITDVNHIRTGDQLYVPRLPNRPVATMVAAGTSAPGGGSGALVPVGCDDPWAYISSPLAGQTITTFVPISGTAAIYNFLYYQIEIRADGAAVYNFYTRSDAPVFNNVLGHLDPTVFPAGLYWIRLVVFDINNTIPSGATCAIPIRLE